MAVKGNVALRETKLYVPMYGKVFLFKENWTDFSARQHFYRERILHNHKEKSDKIEDDEKAIETDDIVSTSRLYR